MPAGAGVAWKKLLEGVQVLELLGELHDDARVTWRAPSPVQPPAF